jgi:hypothetical protein
MRTKTALLYCARGGALHSSEAATMAPSKPKLLYYARGGALCSSEARLLFKYLIHGDSRRQKYDFQ